MDGFLAEKRNFKIVGGPVDLSTAANGGARVSMKNAERIAFLVIIAAGAAATLQMTLRQHNAASAGTSKDLAVSNPYFTKVGAETKFTKVVPGADVALYDLGTLVGTGQALVILEVLAEDLDREGFTHVSLDLADAGASARLGAILASVESDKMPAYSIDI